MQDNRRDNPENFHSVRALLKPRGVSAEDSPAYRDCPDKMLDFSIVTGDFFEIPDPSTGFLRFKKTADVAGFRHITETLPELQHLAFRDKEDIPYYASHLDAVRDALDNDPESLCVEGGPCLFGENEVIVEVILNDGAGCSFDYSTGKAYDAGITYGGGGKTTY